MNSSPHFVVSKDSWFFFGGVCVSAETRRIVRQVSCVSGGIITSGVSPVEERNTNLKLKGERVYISRSKNG